VGIVAYSVYKLVMILLESDTHPRPQEKIDVDSVIEHLEFQIMRAEMQAENGIKEAEETLVYLKEQLEKARTVKSKLK
jgi:hypothetical protein